MTTPLTILFDRCIVLDSMMVGDWNVYQTR